MLVLLIVQAQQHLADFNQVVLVYTHFDNSTGELAAQLDVWRLSLDTTGRIDSIGRRIFLSDEVRRPAFGIDQQAEAHDRRDRCRSKYKFHAVTNAPVRSIGRSICLGSFSSL